MTPGPIRPLSARQLEVVDCIVRGLSYKEIAAALTLSVKTVDTHVRQIAQLIDGYPELPPRFRIFAWAMYQKWERDHADVLQRGRAPAS